MSPIKQIYRLGLVGAGRQGLAILEALVPARRDDQPLRVVGVADLNPEAPGILYAYRHNLFVSLNFNDLLQLPELDILLNATGRPEVTQELQAHCPEGVSVLNCDRPPTGKDFWDIVSNGLSFTEEYFPLKIGIVGGGRGCQRVLQQMATGLRHRQRINIIGVADPDPQASGMVLAQKLGIPTFGEAAALLEQNPDLILELTGDPQVRESVIQQKPAHTLIVDHIQSRLFWELFKKEEDRLRLKVESEIKLADQRSHFQRIFDYLPDPVLVLNPDYTIEEVNQTFLNRFQKKAGELIGKHCYEVFHQLDEPCDRQGLVCPLPQVIKECVTGRVLQSYAGPDGMTRYDEITMSPLCPPEAKRRRVIEVIKDVTAHQQLAEALHDSEDKTRLLLKQATKSKVFLETIVNGIEDHMMVIDLDYRIIEVNRALLEMVGLKREEVVGKHCYEVSHHLESPCTSPDHPCPLKDAVATGKAASATHVHFDKDSREHYIHVVCHPLFDEEGRVHRVIDLSRDITKEITDRTRMLHDDKMTSLGKLSASVVHEINNPLTGILNFTKLMQRMLANGTPGEEELGQMHNYLGIIYNETFRVSKTVSNLLAFSRKNKPEFKPVDLNALLGQTLSLTEYQMRLQGVKVERQLAPDLAPVLADQGWMKQAFLNLVLNALDAMPEGGTLTLTTKNSRRREVVVRVADTGVGIPKESFSQIFEPFYTTKKAGSGVGLGLSVVYGIIRDHRGAIKVDSVVGQGTTFTIRLPAFKPGEDSAAA
ncbi:MAG: PAS domain-containing protein [Deltaproteobacteria bacterium]|nr:PAS domain-containing protein [Deltaproteobacteria bacterium]